jgi:hypothetical protein
VLCAFGIRWAPLLVARLVYFPLWIVLQLVSGADLPRSARLRLIYRAPHGSG